MNQIHENSQNIQGKKSSNELSSSKLLLCTHVNCPVAISRFYHNLFPTCQSKEFRSGDFWNFMDFKEG